MDPITSNPSETPSPTTSPSHSPFKKWMFRLGIAALFLIILVGIGIAISVFQGTKLDRQSKEATERMVTSICTSWDIEVMKKFESPNLAKNVSDQDLKRYFSWFSQNLGPIKNISSSVGDSLIYYNFLNFSRNISASYNCTVTFEKAPATINLKLVYLDGQWLIDNFALRSEALGPRYSDTALRHLPEDHSRHNSGFISFSAQTTFPAQWPMIPGLSSWAIQASLFFSSMR